MLPGAKKWRASCETIDSDGNLDAVGYQAKGMPMGIGGVIRLHLGEHFRIGSEGYVSTLSQHKI